MPRLIQPLSLRKVSLQCIESNYSRWCVEQSPTQSDVVSPFLGIPDDMIQELYFKLLYKRWSNANDVYFMLHPGIRHLSLRDPTDLDDKTSWILTTRCQNLTHLNLDGMAGVDPAVLCKIVKELNQLVCLQLACTCTDRTVLKAIADNCHKLLDLDVQGCTKLRNEDFLALCTQPEPSGNHLQLRTLTLDEGMFRISEDTVVSLLSRHRKLQSLGKCELIDKALDRMYGKEYQLKKEVSQSCIHNLSEVTIYDRKGEILNLGLTTLCFPNLATLSLDLSDGAVRGLSAVSKLKNLKAFNVWGCDYRIENSVSFKIDIIPILEQIGHNLTDLQLKYTREVCVVRIGQLCPNLESLRLQILPIGSKSACDPAADNQYFRQLRVLEINDEYGMCFKAEGTHAEALSMILENAIEISQISFFSVKNLTDSIISKANRKHAFRFLTKVRFCVCSSISTETGRILLSPDNPLEQLIFYRCLNVSRNLEQYAKDRRLNINLRIR